MDEFRWGKKNETIEILQNAKEAVVIARVWHGCTKPGKDAEAYENMLKPELLPGIGKVKGYKGSYLLRREGEDEVEFITILLWDSIDSIRAFAGADYETSIIPEERRKHLTRHDAKAKHYEIVATHKPETAILPAD